MPTYDYECPEGHRFERFQKMSDPPGAECPQCGAPAERKISGGAGFLFKGEGFYITDYRSDDYKKKASADAGPGTSSGGEGGSKKAAADGASSSGSASSAAPAGDGSGGGSGSSSPSSEG